MDYLHPWIPILMIIVLAVIFATITITAGTLIGPRRPWRAKFLAYESGMEPFHEANIRIPIKFYLVALLFLVFDMETILILAWAIAFRTPIEGFQLYAFFVMVVFMLILIVGFLYEWRKGALEWN